MGLQNIGVDIMNELCLLSLLFGEQANRLFGSEVKGKIEGVDEDARKDLHIR